MAKITRNIRTAWLSSFKKRKSNKLSFRRSVRLLYVFFTARLAGKGRKQQKSWIWGVLLKEMEAESPRCRFTLLCRLNYRLDRPLIEKERKQMPALFVLQSTQTAKVQNKDRTWDICILVFRKDWRIIIKEELTHPGYWLSQRKALDNVFVFIPCYNGIHTETNIIKLCYKKYNKKAGYCSCLCSEDDFRWGCRNISHQQQFFPELHPPDDHRMRTKDDHCSNNPNKYVRPRRVWFFQPFWS